MARKAAMLLRSLDPPTAAELLRSAGQETITEIAAELAYLDRGADGQDAVAGETVREFFGLLNDKRGRRVGGGFVEEMLQIVLGAQKSQEVLVQVADRLKSRDPFLGIRSADVSDVAAALAGESAQVTAVVLAELSAKKSVQLLAVLDEAVRAQTVRCMIAGGEISAEARRRIATTIQGRLKQAARGGAVGPTDAGRQRQLRKVAVLLRGLDAELRNALIDSLAEQDAQAPEAVRKLMVVWEDVDQVAERALQEALRSVAPGRLAAAMAEADPRTVARIRANISERAKAMLDEEASLMSAPNAGEIEQAREEILNALRDMNNRGELQFEET